MVIKDADKHNAPKRPHRAKKRNAVFGPQGRDDHDMFFAAVRMSPVPMCLTDPNQPGNPLVFVNRAFEDLTGYAEEDVLGRNCRFLQGPDTDLAVVAEVGRSVAAKVDVSVEFYNYRKDGSGFWNALYLSPVFSDAGDLLYFFASQLDVTKRREAEAIIQQRQQQENLGSRGDSQPEGQEPAVAKWPGDDVGSSRSTSALRDGAALMLQPVWVNTQADDEEGFLVFGDGRLVAVLVRLSDQHGALAGQ